MGFKTRHSRSETERLTNYGQPMLTKTTSPRVTSPDSKIRAGMNCLSPAHVSVITPQENIYCDSCETNNSANLHGNIPIRQTKLGFTMSCTSMAVNGEVSKTTSLQGQAMSYTMGSLDQYPNLSSLNSTETPANACSITTLNTAPQSCSISQLNTPPTKSNTSSPHQATTKSPFLRPPNSQSSPSFVRNPITVQPKPFISNSLNHITPMSCNSDLPQQNPTSCKTRPLCSTNPSHPRLPQVLTLAVILLLGLPVVTQAVDTKTEVHISVLVPDDDILPFTRKKMQPAIELAVEKVTDPGGLLQEVEVHVHYADSKCDIAHGIKGAIELHYRGEADVFLGPVCDYTAAPVARQSVFWDTPVLTFAQAKDFREEKMLSKVTRVGNDFFQLGKFFSTMLQMNEWDKFTILYDPEAWRDLINMLGHIMAESIHSTVHNLTGVISSYYKINLKEESIDQLLLDNVGIEFAGE